MIGGVGWIEGPGAIGVDGQTSDGCAKELEGEGFIGIGIGSGEFSADGVSIFCCCLSLREGGDRSVIGAGECDDEGASTCVAGAISDGVVNGDGLCFVFDESVVGLDGRVEGPGAIGTDGETVNGVGAREGVGQGFVGIDIGCCELTDESDAAF